MLFTFDSKKQEKKCLKSVAPQPFLHPRQKGRDCTIWTVFKSGTNLFKNTFVWGFFIIKLALPNVAYRSKAHTCLRFDTKL